MRKTDAKGSRITRVVAAAAIAVGLGAGSYGIAAAASGTNLTATDTAQSTPAAPDANHPWGGQRSDETPLTGDALAKVTAAAKAEVANATIVRVETDADGHAAYEAHIVTADGTPATVYVDKQFNVVSVETR
jgi:uncharacterized membrane protein YkoI